jgi:RES domain-containing protein
MVAVWRIATDTPDYTADDLAGTGAKKSGGRWNRPGIALVYASGSAALACLETLVHLSASPLPLNRYLVRIDIPDDLFARRTPLADLAPASGRVGWDAEPVGRTSLELGSNWATSLPTAVLEVPSVIIPEEPNYLINPAHPDAASIAATKLRRFEYDRRLRAGD